MHDVIYVPKLHSNLLSVTKLMERGLKRTNFTNCDVVICKNDNEIIAKGRRFDNHFAVRMIPVHESIKYEINSTCVANENNNEANSSKFSNDASSIWHRRLGHVNDKYIQKLIKELVTGINNEIKDINCEPCKMCKLSRKPHKSVAYDQSCEPLDLLHLDICGPLPVESIGGSKYILLVIDDYSGMYFTYFLKRKSDAFSAFHTFKEKCEKTLSKGIKCIRTDNGTEFINKHFEEFTRNEGIDHQKTVPCNPESNGKVERGNRIILERAHTLLHDSDLPLSFWAEAVAYVTHIVNITPRKNKSKSHTSSGREKYPMSVI